MFKNISALLYPPRCGACKTLLHPDRKWCSQCWTQIARSTAREYCRACGSNLGPHQSINSKGKCSVCRKLKLPFEGICRLGAYEASLSQAVINFKFHHSFSTGQILADMLAETLKEQSWIDTLDAFCAIPIHWTRRIDRGFNQSQILADRISQIIQIPVIKLLKRKIPTIRQVGLSAARRKENVKNIFKQIKKWPVEGTSICLIDDVMTTGSTLSEAAKTLRRAGAEKVYAAVLAKADDTRFDS